MYWCWCVWSKILMNWCEIYWCHTEGSSMLWMVDWKRFWMKGMVGLWVEFRVVFRMVKGAG